jgi:hypothetical protein
MTLIASMFDETKPSDYPDGHRQCHSRKRHPNPDSGWMWCIKNKRHAGPHEDNLGRKWTNPEKE